VGAGGLVWAHNSFQAVHATANEDGHRPTRRAGGTAITGPGIGATDTLLVAVNLLPLTWMFIGLGIALFGLIPRLTAPIAYGAVLVAYVLDIVGGIVEIPERILELGPFRHIAAVPAADFAVGAAMVMLGVGIAAAALGAFAFRRRDLQEA
jgi:ABC-2 type transport system permease protein